MKLKLGHHVCSPAKGWRFQEGFTLTELLVVVSIVTIMIAGVVSSQMFGMRLSAITGSMLGAGQEVRRGINELISDVQAARMVRVGQAAGSGFTQAQIDSPQQGNALQIHLTTDTNLFIRYFRDASDRKLKRMTNGAAAVGLAEAVTNQVVFALENFAGEILTDTANNCVVRMTLQFDPLVNPGLRIGENCYYESYRLRTRVTHRSSE